MKVSSGIFWFYWRWSLGKERGLFSRPLEVNHQGDIAHLPWRIKIGAIKEHLGSVKECLWWRIWKPLFLFRGLGRQFVHSFPVPFVSSLKLGLSFFNCFVGLPLFSIASWLSLILLNPCLALALKHNHVFRKHAGAILGHINLTNLSPFFRLEVIMPRKKTSKGFLSRKSRNLESLWTIFVQLFFEA